LIRKPDKETDMPLLMILGIIVIAIGVAIFKVNKAKSDKFIECVKNAKEADDADDTGRRKK
jgi:uncharacterized protein YxeA